MGLPLSFYKCYPDRKCMEVYQSHEISPSRVRRERKTILLQILNEVKMTNVYFIGALNGIPPQI